MPRDPNIRTSEKMSGPIVGEAWHKDGTPFEREDYIKAGLTPPTNEQLIAWRMAELEDRAGGNA